MSTYQTIVAGVHDSQTGMRTVELAGLVAAETVAALVLTAAHEAGAAGAVQSVLANAATRCTEMGAEDVRTHAVAGEPVQVLTGTAREHRAELILVGSQGLSTLTGRLLGSVPSGVAGEAACDVLIVHTTTDRWRKLISRRHRKTPSRYLRTVVVGVHDSTRSMRAVERAASIAADAGARLVLVGAYVAADRKVLAHATDALKRESYIAQESVSIETSMRRAEGMARASGVESVETLVVRGEAMSGLLEVADEREADLLVMGNHQLSGAGAHLIGSISLQVSRKTPTHVLLVQ